MHLLEPSNWLLGINSSEMNAHVHQKRCTRMFTADLFMIARCPAMEQWINKMNRTAQSHIVQATVLEVLILNHTSSMLQLCYLEWRLSKGIQTRSPQLLHHVRLCMQATFQHLCYMRPLPTLFLLQRPTDSHSILYFKKQGSCSCL